MCGYGACRGAGQRLGPSNPRVGQLWSPNGGEDGLPDPHTPGWIWLWSPNGEYDSFSNLRGEKQWLSLPFAIGKIRATIWKVTGSGH